MKISEWLLLIDHFQGVLKAAQKHREERNEFVGCGPRGGWNELGWVVFERETMWVAVNEKRAEFHLPPLPIERVERVENCAVNHADYSHKFALYCAELAISE